MSAAAEHGLAPLTGSSPEVGVVSYHLGGGIGILGRSLGWAVDHVRTLEVVTADGVLRRVTATEETELFWALRGGGKGTLGVVVALEIDLHPIARLYGGGMHFAAADAERVLTTWAAWTQSAPEAMGSSALLIQMPDLPVLPEALRGQYVVHLRFAFTGTAAQGEQWVRPFRDLGPMSDTVAEMPYSAVGSIHAEPTTPVPFHARNTMLTSLDAAAVAELLRHAEPEQAPAVHAAYTQLFTAMVPWSTGGVCVNFLSGPDVTAAQLATGYLPADVARLAAIKRVIDPSDVFRTHYGRAVAITA